MNTNNLSSNYKIGLLTIVIGLLVSSCEVDQAEISSIKEECRGFVSGGLSQQLPEIHESIKNIFEAAYTGESDQLFKSLPSSYRRYAKILDKDWRLICLDLKYYRKQDEDFLYLIYSSVESLGNRSSPSEGVLIFNKIDGKWNLVNFPFWRSSLPEFYGKIDIKVQ